MLIPLLALQLVLQISIIWLTQPVEAVCCCPSVHFRLCLEVHCMYWTVQFILSLPQVNLARRYITSLYFRLCKCCSCCYLLFVIFVFVCLVCSFVNASHNTVVLLFFMIFLFVCIFEVVLMLHSELLVLLNKTTCQDQQENEAFMIQNATSFIVNIVSIY